MNLLQLLTSLGRFIFSQKGLMTLLLFSRAFPFASAVPKNLNGEYGVRIFRLEFPNEDLPAHFNFPSTKGKGFLKPIEPYETVERILYKDDVMTDSYKQAISDADAFLRRYWDANPINKLRHEETWKPDTQTLSRIEFLKKAMKLMFEKSVGYRENLDDLQYRYGLLTLLENKREEAARILIDVSERANPDNYLYTAFAEQVLLELGMYTEANRVWDLALQREPSLKMASQYIWSAISAKRYVHGQKLIDKMILSKIKNQELIEPEVLLLPFEIGLTHFELEDFLKHLIRTESYFEKHFPEEQKHKHKLYLWASVFFQSLIESKRYSSENERMVCVKKTEEYSNKLKNFDYPEKNEILNESLESLQYIYKHRYHFFNKQYALSKWLEKTNEIIDLNKWNLEFLTEQEMFVIDQQILFGNEFLENLQGFLNGSSDHENYLEVLHGVAALYIMKENWSEASVFLNEFLNKNSFIQEKHIFLYIKLYKKTQNEKALEKIYQRIFAFHTNNIILNIDAMYFYLEVGDLAKAESVVKKIHRDNPDSILAVTAMLDFYLHQGKINKLLLEADKILLDENLSRADKLDLFSLIISALSHPKYKDSWINERESYQVRMEKELGEGVEISSKVKERVDDWIKKAQLKTKPDYTLRNSLATVVLSAGGLVGWTLVKSRRRKYAEKKHTEKVKGYITLLKEEFLKNQIKASKKQKSNKENNAINRNENKSLSEGFYTLAEIFNFQTNNTKFYRIPKSKAKRQTQEVDVQNVEEAIPAVIEPEIPFVCDWEEPGIPSYNEENARYFINVEVKNGLEPNVPTFFTVTPNVFDNLSDEIHANRLINKLKERPEIGKNSNLAWRTYDQETKNKELKYKIRLRLKSIQDKGIYARCVYARNNKNEIIAELWIFDLVRNHVQEERDLKLGNGVGELIDKINPPFIKNTVNPK